MNYQTAVEKLGGRESRKVGNNTYLKRRENGAVALVLHTTDILTWTKDGAVVYNTGGWRTVTTKERFNSYGPAIISQDKGRWYIYKNGAAAAEYQDGAIITAAGDIQNALPINKAADKKAAVLKREIGKYCADYMAAFFAGNIPAPSGGDCWHCAMETAEGRTMGELSGQTPEDHITQHIKEKYYVPSLIVNAAETFGASIMAKQAFAYQWAPAEDRAKHGPMPEFVRGIATDQLGRALRRYVSRKMGLAA